MVSSVGGKLIDYHITRGQYDFVMITEAESFESNMAMAKGVIIYIQIQKTNFKNLKIKTSMCFKSKSR